MKFSTWARPDHQEGANDGQHQRQQAPTGIGKGRKFSLAEIESRQQRHTKNANQEQKTHKIGGKGHQPILSLGDAKTHWISAKYLSKMRCWSSKPQAISRPSAGFDTPLWGTQPTISEWIGSKLIV